MNDILVIGAHVQGLIAANLLAISGHRVQLIDVSNDDYVAFFDGFKTGPVTHSPFRLPRALCRDLALDQYGFDDGDFKITNPYESLSCFSVLKKMIDDFNTMEQIRPPYHEKAWRDAWNTYEIGRCLAEAGEEAQKIFVDLSKISLIDFVNAYEQDKDKRSLQVAHAILGSKTDPEAKETAAAILPVIAAFSGAQDDADLTVQGSLHSLIRALTQAAMANGVNIIEGLTLSTISVDDSAQVKGIVLSDNSRMEAPSYVFDCDPVALFERYVQGYKPSPTFENRVTANQNLKQALRVKMALSSLPQGWDGSDCLIAPDMDYIVSAYKDFKADGRTKLPIVSVINTGRDNPSLAPDGQVCLDLSVQYFDSMLDLDDRALIDASIAAMVAQWPDVKDKILYTQVLKVAPFSGMPDFIGAMPLLRLFKIFSGYHSLAYDVPLINAVMAGYGCGTAAHHHVHDGGLRVANLYSQT